MKICFLGNFSVDYSSETHHVKSLRALGHEVIALQEGKATGEEILDESIKSELLVFVHTHLWVTPGLPLQEVFKQLKGKVPIVSYHLDLWLGLDRQKDLETDPFYKLIDHWFVTDKLMADWLNKNTDVKGHYLPAGVFSPEAIMLDKQNEVPDVVFVGSKGYHPEHPYRPQLIDWLQETYGDNFGHYSGEEGTLGLKRGLHLNQLYADTKVVVGDSLCLNFNYPYYWSDRLYETIGRGGFLIMPYIKGLDDEFEDGKHLVFYEYGDFKDLKSKIDFYIDNETAREYIRHQGYLLVKNKHTYLQRWGEILNAINKD
jgi:hypothetical protein